MSNEIPATSSGIPLRPVNSGASGDVTWFVEKVKECAQDNLVNITVYGPAVTMDFDRRRHRIHHLIVLKRRDVDQLIKLAQHSKPASTKRIAAPLIMTEPGMLNSRDVFPLEWLDIAQFHATVVGEALMDDLILKPTLVRLHCERELRSLDILLLRGILMASDSPHRMALFEHDASDNLVRVLRGMLWLVGDRRALLPQELCASCESVVGFELRGWAQAIRFDGRHDVETVRAMVGETEKLSQWVDSFQVVDSQ